MTKTTLRLGFAGTPELAAVVLEHLLEYSSHRVEIIYTQPDRPAGRGRKLAVSPVKQLALQHRLQLEQPAKPSELDPERRLAGLDALVVVAYGMILPATLLGRPRHGCINVHTSLLPRWRGAAPIQRAIQAGDTETGVTIMQMDEGLDTGPILAQMHCPIAAHETSGSLHDKLARLGAVCLHETLDKIAASNIHPVSQDSRLATYANKISKAEARLDWMRPALELERTIRAFNPAPVAYTEINGVSLRLWEAMVPADSAAAPSGTIVACSDQGIDVATADGVLRLLKIQPAGKRVMTVREFLNGRPDFFQATRTG